ncbi:hypothetical protein GH714_017490 [Hevea brasiliensis]|uniref:DUF547 domain-containing protein n=1 Tax=Hevea brasiliensis TaxID=3981 RepID=A0A6A6MEC0_HEVBR|nr:hypothetical protein GH714_017490 [Hevea brasiliensis]
MLNNVLNMSPKLSSYRNSIVKSGNMLSSEASLNWNSENSEGFTPCVSIPSNGTPTLKSSDALRKEIATLEAEILHLERYLLSLYRTAFEEHLPATLNVPKNHMQYKNGSLSKVPVNQSHFNLRPHIENSNLIYHDQTSPAHGWASSDDQSCTSSVHTTSRDQRNANSGRCSLADHLGASCLVNSLNIPDRLSEDIMKCMSSIYCRLANPSHSHGGLKEEGGPYAARTEVLKICLDDNSFNYAAAMLKNFRSLVRSLEKVDPRKMKREEKIAFWINIHNALVMHAYLAYGTHNCVKGASILKAAYNIGGHCVNACVIQNSILGIRSHYSEPARVYTAKNIFQELKLAKREFIQASVYIHKEAKIFLPKILSYFAKDMSMDMHGLLKSISGCLTEAQRKAVSKCMKRKVDKYIHWLPQSSSFGASLMGKRRSIQGNQGQSGRTFYYFCQMNPHNAASFAYLGHYYSRLSADSQRALKCYQRAITLNPDDSESGESLCDLLDHSGKETLEQAVCEEASKSHPGLFGLSVDWVTSTSITAGGLKPFNLQHAIRGYPTCADLWEALGLAYQRLGMFTAATKSYGRAIELDDTRVFALVESGNIFLMLGSFRKGVEQFLQALKFSPQNVSAKYGLASGLLGLSKECMNLGAFKWGASLLEDAGEVAEVNAQLAPNVSCIWKLHGDIQLTHAKCFPWTERDHGAEFDADTFESSIFSWKQTCYLAAMSAKRSYQRALHLAPWRANLYIDIAITLDLISSMNENYGHDLYPWQLSEKMACGGLLLEGDNYEFWVALGCLSGHNAMRQHALIRGLQLDVSSAFAWSYLGKLYREEGEKKLARQAFDCARSVDPSLALPWAGMAADAHAREPTTDEAFESCLRAVQILPLAEFQIGLAKLALLSGHLASSQVSTLCSQVQAMSSKSNLRDIAVNLARSLCRAGYAADAVQECENLKKEDIALSLWQLGKSDLALSVARDLAASFNSMEQTSAAASVSFFCRLLYYISGLDSAITSILKMPKELFENSKISFILSTIHALDQSNRLESVVSSSRYSIVSHEDIIGMHYLIALGKLVSFLLLLLELEDLMIKHGSDSCLGFQNGVSYLKKILHNYPNSKLMRNLLSQLLLFTEEWEHAHVASRCCIVDAPYSGNKLGLKSGCEILGAGAVACYTIGNKDPKFSFPTCGYQCMNGPAAIRELQKYLRREPWNHNAQYLLILNILQKAREERFPRQLCVILKRLLLVALYNELYTRESLSYQYQKFQLLLCLSEISLQCGNPINCIEHAKSAVSLCLPDNYRFFGHLLLCRAYAVEGNFVGLQEEYIRCLEVRTDYHIGWICLKIMESHYSIQTDSNISEQSFMQCSKKQKNSWNMWMAVFNLVLGLESMWNRDLLSAEEYLSQACLLASADSCLFLCHGAICMELARKFSSSQLLSFAIRSLTKASVNSVIPLPIISLLRAQAEGSLGSKQRWEENLRLEWYSWPPEMRPAELFFQMHLLASQSEARVDSSSNVEFCQSPQKWVLRSIHTNPSCLRYWKGLQKLME